MPPDSERMRKLKEGESVGRTTSSPTGSTGVRFGTIAAA